MAQNSISGHPNKNLTINYATCNTKLSSGPKGSESVAKRSPIPNASVQSQFDVGNFYPSIACVNHGLAWITIDDEKLHLVDRGGLVSEKINANFGIRDIAVTADGDLLLADRSHNSIRLFTKWKTISTLFTTIGSPRSLCCLHNKDIVITFCDSDEVLVYGNNGEIRRSLDQIKFRHPWKVSANKVNKDIYICDKDDYFDSSAGKVIAVRTDGKLRYEYTGQGDKEFTPGGVCTDQMGNVLIVDHYNHRIHMLDQEGWFIQCILTSEQGLTWPVTVDVDREGYVWVGEQVDDSTGRVKVARYLQ